MKTSHQPELQAHIDRLSRELWFHRVALAGMVLCGGIMLLTAAQESTSDEPVTGKSFQLIDDAGGLRAELKTQDGHPALYMYDANSKQRVALWTDDNATALHLKDGDETTRVGAALFAQGGGFALHGPESRGAAVMTFMDGQREIRFYDDEGDVTERFPEADE
ncbi:MAG: hypothetical protein ACR2NP_12225 [Pirellulaceae bacterium]